jgi:hypothetical protein
MYARVVSGRARGRDLDTHHIVSALRCAPGFSGALGLADAASRDVLLVLFWETEEQAAKPVVIPELSVIGDDVWEVAARV